MDLSDVLNQLETQQRKILTAEDLVKGDVVVSISNPSTVDDETVTNKLSGV